jgi:hypothetical protein
MTELSAGSDLQSIKTTSRCDGGDSVLNASKTFITNGWRAGLVCVAAQTDPQKEGPRICKRRTPANPGQICKLTGTSVWSPSRGDLFPHDKS